MEMPGRKFSSGSYRYGFNGKEMDNEVSGNGNQYDYGFRIYNPRLGRFLSVDPIAKEVPWNSSYAYAENDVIRSIDADGLEKVFVIPNFVGPPTIICFGCGIAQAANNYIGGTVQKDMVENHQMSYNNENVPSSVQERLDKKNTLEADSKIATGIAQTVAIQVENSANISSLIIPLGELKIGGKFLSKVIDFFGGKSKEALEALEEGALDFKQLESVTVEPVPKTLTENQVVNKLTGKSPLDVRDDLLNAGWTEEFPQAANPNKIQHSVYTKTSKSGKIYTIDYHPGGGVHQNAYWKIYYQENSQASKTVLGRISTEGFQKFEKITDSPVYIDKKLSNKTP